MIPDTIDNGADVERLKSLNTVGMVSYILHLIVAVSAMVPGGQLGPLLLLIAIVIDLVNRSKAEGTWHASHFRWRLRSVLFAGVAYLLTAWLWVLFIIPGWIAWVVISLWFLYRIISGMVAMNRGLPMETPA